MRCEYVGPQMEFKVGGRGDIIVPKNLLTVFSYLLKLGAATMA